MTYIYHDDRENTESSAGLDRLLEELKEGDCMVVERFSGAAKSSSGFLSLMQELESRGIRFRSLEENFDTGTEQGRFAAEILKKVAQLDGEPRREKQREDSSAKEESKFKGRKPIEVDELLLRIEALLRRARIERENRLVVGGTVLDAQEMSAYVNGVEVPLTVREFSLLYKMLSYPRRTFSRAQLMDEFWSGETSASLRAVDVHITRIRDKFSTCEDFRIVTVHGLGYKAVPCV